MINQESIDKFRLELPVFEKKMCIRDRFMLQTRNGKRTATAAIKVACDLVDEGMISKEEAICMAVSYTHLKSGVVPGGIILRLRVAQSHHQKFRRAGHRRSGIETF